MITAKINVGKIDKTALFEGKNGKYLDLVLFENKGGTDQYGNDGFVTQDIGRKRREAGERGPIIGNYQNKGTKGIPQSVASVSVVEVDQSDIPF